MSSLRGWKSRTLQLAKSSTRLNALMGAGEPVGLLMSMGGRKKKILRSQDQLMNQESEDDNKIVFYITPQVKVDRIIGLIEAAIDQKMSEDVDNKLYDPIRAKLMSQALSKDVRNRVKQMQLHRYRVVCLVSIIEKLLQSVDYKMRLCIDNNFDYHANHKFESAQYYIITTVFIIYKD